MDRRRWLPGVAGAAMVVALAAAGCGGDPPVRPAGPGQVATTQGRPAAGGRPAYTNPVLDRDFPDPAAVRAPDGWWYGYATQTSEGGRWANIPVARSRDLVAWEPLGDALPAKPAWAATTQDFWAPDVVRRDGTWLLYYAAVPDSAGEEERQCLGVATSPSPAGPFADSGRPLLCRDGFDIDATAFRDPRTGEWLLFWARAGDIAVRRLAADLRSLDPGDPERALLRGESARSERPYEQIVEGPFVVERRGWYYLFYSGDNCCDYPAHYAVLVARARHPTGPYQRLGDATGRRSSVILAAGGRWNGPGHGSVVTDGAGQHWLIYHAIDTGQPELDDGGVRRPMLLDRLVWRGGWPSVPGATPSTTSRPGPVPSRS